MVSLGVLGALAFLGDQCVPQNAPIPAAAGTSATQNNMSKKRACFAFTSLRHSS